MTLRPCDGCARHVRATEASCPFCATPMPALLDPPDEPAAAARPASRHALMFGVAVGAIAVSTTLFGTGCPAYGGPLPDRVDVGSDPDTGASPSDGGR